MYLFIQLNLFCRPAGIHAMMQVTKMEKQATCFQEEPFVIQLMPTMDFSRLIAAQELFSVVLWYLFEMRKVGNCLKVTVSRHPFLAFFSF